jgi:hypothetical protein
VKEVEMLKLLECGIIEPFVAPCGTSNVMVSKKALPDGTPGGLRETADMRAINAVTVGDVFPLKILERSRSGWRRSDGIRQLIYRMDIGTSG